MTEESPSAVWLACLCAAWCRVCGEYAVVLRSVVGEFTAVEARWIDVEDEAALVDEVDVETFPTLLIGDARGLWFAGPLPPQAEVLRRLLASLLRAPPEPLRDGPYFALAERLRGSFARGAA